MTWLFSYGQQVDPPLMEAEVGRWEQAVRAQLPDYGLRFGEQHGSDGGAVTVVPLTGATTLGVAYLLDNRQIGAVTSRGPDRHLCRTTIATADGPVEALMLEPADPILGRFAAPSITELEHVRTGLCLYHPPEIVVRYLEHAAGRSAAAVDVPRQGETPDSFAREYGVSLRRLFPWKGTGANPFGSAWAHLDPGEATTPHSHDERETFIIVSGRGCMTVDGTTFPVVKADTIYLEPFSAHTLVNDSSRPLEMLCVWWDEVVPTGTA